MKEKIAEILRQTIKPGELYTKDREQVGNTSEAGLTVECIDKWTNQIYSSVVKAAAERIQELEGENIELKENTPTKEEAEKLLVILKEKYPACFVVGCDDCVYNIRYCFPRDIISKLQIIKGVSGEEVK